MIWQQNLTDAEVAMLDKILFFGIGLIVGWNVLPQPTWVKNIYEKAIAKIKGFLSPKSE
jgi:hypothetical protein